MVVSCLTSALVNFEHRFSKLEQVETKSVGFSGPEKGCANAASFFPVGIQSPNRCLAVDGLVGKNHVELYLVNRTLELDSVGV